MYRLKKDNFLLVVSVYEANDESENNCIIETMLSQLNENFLTTQYFGHWVKLVRIDF